MASSSILQNLLDLPRLDSSVIQSILGSSSSLSQTNGGIEYDDQGVPLMFRDSHFASNEFGTNNLWFFNVPRYKFLYFVKFVTTSIAQSSVNSSSYTLDMSDQSFLITSFQKPTVIMDARTLNQYNKKRIIYTGRKYNPVDFEIWDTGNNQFYDLFKVYFSFYYGDSVNTDSSAWAKDTTSAKFNDGANGWGYQIPKNSTLTSDSFFEKIQIYEFSGGDYRTTELINPKFTEVKYDDLSYSDGKSLSKFRVRLEYEGINYLEEDISLLSDTDLMSEFDLTSTSFYEPKRLVVSNTVLDFVPSVSFNNQSADTDYTVQTTQSGISSLRNTDKNLSSISGWEGVFNSSTNALNTIGDIVTQNSGTLTQLGVSTGITNSITRGLSSVIGGVF